VKCPKIIIKQAAMAIIDTTAAIAATTVEKGGK
jgi:hypothetical protein